MKLFPLFLSTISLFISCVDKNNNANNEDPAPLVEQDYFVFDLEKSIDSATDTILLNDLIEDISYLPLETGKDFMLPNFNYMFAKIGDNIFIGGGAANLASPVFQFDSLGRFVKTAIHLGRGSNEVVRPMTMYYNVNLKQINIVGAGPKMVIMQTESGKKSDVVNKLRGYNWVPLSDSTFVSTQRLFSRDIPKTYLYFADITGTIVQSIERNDEKLKYNLSDVPEGTYTGPYEDYWLAPDFTGDAIFHDIFNDTLYRVRSHHEITPHLVFRRGVLSPDPKDIHKPENRKKQVYFTNIKESVGYVFLNYYYGGKLWQDVWSKSDSSLLIHTAPEKFGSVADIFIPFALLDGSVIDLPIVYTEKEHVYGIMEAMDACKFLPDVKEDDNPVILIAKLKK